MSYANSIDPRTFDAEVELLVLQLRQAHTTLDRAIAAGDQSAIVRGIQKATDNYGSVKDVLPKLGLAPNQIASVREQLARLHARLIVLTRSASANT
jgi:hypothetical protein